MSNIFQNLQLQRIADAIENGQAGGEITIDVTGAGDMQGATASTAGVHGLVPAPQAGDERKVLSGAGTWINGGGGCFIDTNNIIVNVTPLPSGTVTYTATEPCILYVQLGGNNRENYVEIDGVRVFYSYNTSWAMESGLIPMYTGQTATIIGRQANDEFAVYGILQS